MQLSGTVHHHHSRGCCCYCSIMKVVGLISGGKDSIFNLHLCKYLGHDVVCVANLHPPLTPLTHDDTGDEMDSYM